MGETKQKKQGRRIVAWGCAAALVIVLAVMPMLAEGSQGSSNRSVLSAEAQYRDMEVKLIGGGQLSGEAAVRLEIPEGVKLTEYLVTNGDRVSQGDPVATVDRVSVMTAIVGVQETLDYLSGEIASVSDEKGDTTVTARSGGTVKAVYAREGQSVSQTMLEHGTLAVLSLDGLMAVQVERQTELKSGDQVEVTLESGKSAEGTVRSNLGGVLTVTIEDDGYAIGTQVTLRTQDRILGSGELYVFSAWNAAAYAGTVSDVLVKEGDTVYAGQTLLRVEDSGHTAEFQQLIDQRHDYEELMEELFQLYDTQTLTAPCDGIVSGVDTDGAYLLSGSGGTLVRLLSFLDRPEGFDLCPVQVRAVSDTGMELWVDPSPARAETMTGLSGYSAALSAMTKPWSYQGDTTVYTQDENGLLHAAGTARVGDILLAVGDEEQVFWFISLDGASSGWTPQTGSGASRYTALLSGTGGENVTQEDTTKEDTSNGGSSDESASSVSSPGTSSSGENTSSESSSGTSSSGENTSSENSPGTSSSGENTSGESSPGTGSTGEGTSGGSSSGTSSSGESTSSESSSGTGSTGEGTPGGSSTGEGSPGGSTTGEETPGEEIYPKPEPGIQIQIVTTALNPAVKGQFYSVSLRASDGDTQLSGGWDLVGGSLPQGISLSSDGVISGTPVEEGVFPITVRFTYGDESVEANLSLTVSAQTVYQVYAARVVERTDEEVRVMRTASAYTVTDLSSLSAISVDTGALTQGAAYPARDINAAVGDMVWIILTDEGNVVKIQPISGGGGEMPGSGGMSGFGSLPEGISGGMFSGISGISGGAAQATVFQPYTLGKLTVASVTSQERMRVNITVDELDILNIRTGQSADVTIDALAGETFPAAVTKIGSAGENQGGSSKFAVELTLEKSGDMLPGMSACAFVPLDTVENALCVPTAALNRLDGETVVYTGYDPEKDALTDPVAVTIGAADADQVQILEGLEPGTTVYYAYYDTVSGTPILPRG